MICPKPYPVTVQWVVDNGAYPCNWTLAMNITKLAPPGMHTWSMFPSICGSGTMPNLNCTATCAEAYPNSSFWDNNCTLYD